MGRFLNDPVVCKAQVELLATTKQQQQQQKYSKARHTKYIENVNQLKCQSLFSGINEKKNQYVIRWNCNSMLKIKKKNVVCWNFDPAR